MDKTHICNLALAHVASSAELTNVDLDRTKEAKACQLVFDDARDKVLRDFPWPFATRITLLGLVEDLTADSTSEWDYAYRYPAEAMSFRKIQNEYHQRVDIRATRVPFRIISDDTGKLILTDQVNAKGEWSARITDTDSFSPDFIIALSFYIAFLIAPRVTAGDQFKLGDKAYQHNLIEIEKARVNAVNEQQDDDEPDADMILVRE